MKTNNKKSITINELAEMVGKGFMDMQKQIEGVDVRIDGVDVRIDGVDVRIDGVQNIQKDMLEELKATHEDVRYLKNTMSKMVQSEIAQDTAIENIKTRVHRVEKKVGLV